jgi:hypothetical protein
MTQLISAENLIIIVDLPGKFCPKSSEEDKLAFYSPNEIIID